MTVYESMMIMLTFGLFLVALLSYLHKSNKKATLISILPDS